VRSCRHPAAETGHLLTAFTGQCCRGAFRPADGRPPPAATARAGARSRGCPGAGGLSGSPAGHDEHAAGTQDAHGTYLTVSLPTGARRGTTRPHLEQRRPRWRTGADVPVLPHMRVWRSVGPVARPRPGPRGEPSPYRIVRSSRSASNTTARPTLANAQGAGWADHDVVFASANGAALDSAKVRRGLRNITAAGGLDPDARTPRELRHSFVSLLSDEGVPIEQIARLICRRIEGHRGRLPQATATGHRRGRDSHEPRLPGRPWP